MIIQRSDFILFFLNYIQMYLYVTRCWLMQFRDINSHSIPTVPQGVIMPFIDSDNLIVSGLKVSGTTFIEWCHLTEVKDTI